MPAAKKNFIIQWGDVFQLQINLRSGPESDIADYSGELVIQNDDKTALLEITTDNEMLVLHNGYIVVEVPQETITALDITGLSRSGKLVEQAPCGEFPYEGQGPLADYYLRVTSLDGRNNTLLKGLICFDGA